MGYLLNYPFDVNLPLVRLLDYSLNRHLKSFIKVEHRQLFAKARPAKRHTNQIIRYEEDHDLSDNLDGLADGRYDRPLGYGCASYRFRHICSSLLQMLLIDNNGLLLGPSLKTLDAYDSLVFSDDNIPVLIFSSLGAV